MPELLLNGRRAFPKTYFPDEEEAAGFISAASLNDMLCFSAPVTELGVNCVFYRSDLSSLDENSQESSMRNRSMVVFCIVRLIELALVYEERGIYTCFGDTFRLKLTSRERFFLLIKSLILNKYYYPLNMKKWNKMLSKRIAGMEINLLNVLLARL